MDLPFPEPEEAFPSEEELLEGLDPPQPNSPEDQFDELEDRIDELEEDLDLEEWIRERLAEWLRRQEAMRTAVRNRDTKTISQLQEDWINETDYPLGPTGPEYGPRNRDMWVPWVLPESPNPFEREYDLDDELAEALGDLLESLVGNLFARVLPAGIGQDVITRIAKRLGQEAISGLGIQGDISLKADRLQVWMHLKSDNNARLRIRRLRPSVYREARRIAEVPPIESFVAADVFVQIFSFVRTLANLISDLIRDPAGLLGKAVRNELDAGAIQPPSTDNIQSVVDGIQSGIFDNLTAKGLPCRPRVTRGADRVTYAYNCARDVQFVPTAGPLIGSSGPRFPDHLTGNIAFFPVILLNRVVPPAQQVFIRRKRLYYYVAFSLSHSTDLENLIEQVAGSVARHAVGAVADKAIEQAGLDSVKSFLGL